MTTFRLPKAFQSLAASLACLAAAAIPAAAQSGGQNFHYNNDGSTNYDTAFRSPATSWNSWFNTVFTGNNNTFWLDTDIVSAGSDYWGAPGQPLRPFSIIAEDPNDMLNPNPAVWRTWSTNGVGNVRILQLQNAGADTTLRFEHVIFQSGSGIGAQNGGMLSFANGGAGFTVTIDGDFIARDNYTNGDGGGIYVGQSSLILTGSLIFQRNLSVASNAASGNRGGAIALGNASNILRIEGVTSFISNTAAVLTGTGGGGAYGGAIVHFAGAVTGTVSLENNILFQDNYASSAGGAIDAEVIVSTSNVWFTGNIAGNSGGALYATESVDLANPSGTIVFSGNQAQTGNGGAIYSAGSVLVAGGASFTNNTAGANGGAIYLSAAAAGGAMLTLDASSGDILFQGNRQNTSAAAGSNAVSIYTSATQAVAPEVVFDTGAGAAAHAIRFYDPISVTDTAGLINVTQAGDGIVAFDTWQSAVSANTVLAGGTMALTRGAIYGAGSDTGSFTVSGSATLAGNGAVQAGAITIEDGARLQVLGGGALSLRAATLTLGSNLQLAGNGTLDFAAPLNAALIDVGSTLADDPAALNAANSPQTLTLGASTPVTLADGGVITIDMFTGASDRLVVDSLTLSGSACVDLIGVVSGSFNVISAGNDISGFNFLPLVNGAVATGHFAANESFANSGKDLWIAIVSQNIETLWTGADGGVWKPQGQNWNGLGGDTSFLNGDAVTFDDTASGKTVIIDAAGVIVTTMTVANDAGNDYTFAGAGGITSGTAAADYMGTVVAPTGKLFKTGSGALNFTNAAANNFTGGIEIAAGSIGFTDGAQLGAGGAGIHFTGDAILRANAPATLASDLTIDPGINATIDTAGNTLAYAGVLHGGSTSALVKTGDGALSVISDNSAAAVTTIVSQGILAIDGANGKLGGVIDIAAGATLAGGGHATGTVNAGPGALIAPGALSSATPATLNIAALNLDSATLRFNIFSSGTSDALNAGALTLAGASTIDINTFTTGTFDLGSGLNALAGAPVTISGLAQVSGARQSAKVVTAANGTDLLLETQADISRNLWWTGAVSGTWAASDDDWTDRGPTTLFAGGDHVIFDDSAPASAPHDIFNAGNGLTVSDMTVDGASNYSFTGAGITADPASVMSGLVIAAGDATGKLTKAGSGTLALANAANNFTGGIELDGGALTFTNGNQLGDGGAGGSGAGILFNGSAVLANASGADQSIASNITVAPGVTGTLDDGGNNLSLLGVLAGGTASAPSAAATGTLAKIGAGALTLAGDSSGADSANLVLALDQGSVFLDNATFAGAIDAAARTTVQSAAGSASTVNLRLAASSTLTGAGAIDGSARLDGAVAVPVADGGVLTLGGAVTGAGGFLKTGAGELDLDGAAALGNTGVTEIDEGTLRITGVSGATDSATIRRAGAIVVDDTGAASAIFPDVTATVSGSTFIIPGGTFAITGSLVVTPSSTATVSGTIVVTPSSTNFAGTFAVPATGAYTLVAPTVLASCTVTVSGSTIVYPSSTFAVANATFAIPGGTYNATLPAGAASGSCNIPVVTIPGYNIASTVAQNILLDGGTLAFGAGAGTPVESTANDWFGVRLIQGAGAATSAVTGANDIIHVGAGDQLYAIQGGIIVAVDAGDATATLGNAANNFTGVVRIDSGTLQVTSSAGLGDFGAATTTTAKVVLNGGALQISGGDISTRRGIELRADGIITVDDGVSTQWAAITRTAGTPAAGLTKAGSGTLVLTGANAASGITVAQGAYVALSTGAAGSSIPITVDDGASFVFSPTNATGSGTLGFMGDQPVMAATIGSYFTGQGTLAITNGHTVLMGNNTDIARIDITGSNVLVVATANAQQAGFGPASAITVNQATLVIGGPNAQTLGNVTLANGGTLGFLMYATTVVSHTYKPGDTIYAHTDERGVTIPAMIVSETTIVPAHIETTAQAFKTATLAGLSGNGTLLFNTNLAIGRADQLIINTPVTGSYDIVLSNFGDAPKNYTGAITLIKAPDSPDAAFNAPATIEAGLYTYNISATTAADAFAIRVTGTGAMSNSAAFINSVAAALPLSWFSELDSVNQRLGDLRLDTRETGNRLEAWARGYGEKLNFNARLTGASYDETHYGGEAGVDCKIGDGDSNACLGIFAGCGSAQRDYSIAGDGSLDSAFGGLYMTISAQAGWYLDATAKFNTFKNRFTAVAPTGESATASYTNRAIGGSLEFGKTCDITHGWLLEPQLQVAATVVNGSRYLTSSGLTVNQSPGSVSRARAGFKFGRDIDTAGHGLLNIYIRGYCGWQWTHDGRLSVTTPAGQNAIYDPAIKGQALEGGAGVTWLVTKSTQVYFDYGTTDTDYYMKPWGLNLGIRHTW